MIVSYRVKAILCKIYGNCGAEVKGPKFEYILLLIIRERTSYRRTIALELYTSRLIFVCAVDIHVMPLLKYHSE